MNIDLTHFDSTAPSTQAPPPPPRPAPAAALPQPVVIAQAIQTKGEDPTIHEAALKAALQEMNQRLATEGKQVSLEYNHDIGRVVIRVLDKRTQEVILQMPTEAALDLAQRLSSSPGFLLRDIA